MKIIIGIVVIGMVLLFIFKLNGLGPMIAIGFSMVTVSLININETLNKKE